MAYEAKNPVSEYGASRGANGGAIDHDVGNGNPNPSIPQEGGSDGIDYGEAEVESVALTGKEAAEAIIARKSGKRKPTEDELKAKWGDKYKSPEERSRLQEERLKAQHGDQYVPKAFRRKLEKAIEPLKNTIADLDKKLAEYQEKWKTASAEDRKSDDFVSDEVQRRTLALQRQNMAKEARQKYIKALAAAKPEFNQQNGYYAPYLNKDKEVVKMVAELDPSYTLLARLYDEFDAKPEVFQAFMARDTAGKIAGLRELHAIHTYEPRVGTKTEEKVEPRIKNGAPKDKPLKDTPVPDDGEQTETKPYKSFSSDRDATYAKYGLKR